MRGRWTAVVIAVVVATGGSAYTLGVVGLPTVTDAENHLEAIDDGETLVRTNVTIHNPNPIGITVDDAVITYRVDMGNTTMATGQERGISIETGNQTRSYLTRMNNTRISEWWTHHVRNGEKSTLSVHVDVESPAIGQRVSTTPMEQQLETDITGSFNTTDTRAVHSDAFFVDDPILYVNETSAWWGRVTADESPIVTRLTVYNPKPVPYTVTAVGYDVTMNGVQMGEGTTDRSYVLEPESTATINATTVIENGRLDEWWVTHLENDETTELQFHYYAIVELPTGDEVTIPIEEISHTETVETDIFRDSESSE